MAAIMDSVKAELDEYKRVVREQVAEISRLRSEVERLTVAADALHSPPRCVHRPFGQPI
jgi:hypothetical protein